MNEHQLKKLIVLSGATATGKSNLAIELAKDLGNCDIINFDSLLFYKEISICTAKPTLKEQQNIPHHLIDVASIKDDLNSSHFVNLCRKIIQDSPKNLILTGGSAFYLRSLFTEMYSSQIENPIIKKEIMDLYHQSGIAPIIDYLKIHDPQSLIDLHPNDHYRLTRAMEFHRINGTMISEQKKQKNIENSYLLKNPFSDRNLIHFYLSIPKEQHLEIIKNRTVKMIENGMIDEVHSIIKLGLEKTKPMQSIGPKETLQFIRGEIKSVDELIEKISISTRQLAKSQKTFFQKIGPKIVINPLTEKELMLKELMLK